MIGGLRARVALSMVQGRRSSRAIMVKRVVSQDHYGFEVVEPSEWRTQPPFFKAW